MKIMGFAAEELLPDVQINTVYDYLQQAKKAEIQLFI